MAKWFKNVNLVKNYLSFILTLVSILGVLALGWFKNLDVTTTLPFLLGIYVGARSFEKSSAVIAASRDAACDTRQVIADLSGTQSGPDK